MIIFMGAPLSGENMIMTALELQRSKLNILDYYEGRMAKEEMEKRLARALTGKAISCDWQLVLAAPLVRWVFPQATIYGLVRNGINAVKSYMQMKFYQGNPIKLPFENTTFSPFEKCCFLWNSLNDYMLSNDGINIIYYDNITKELLEKVAKQQVKTFYPPINVKKYEMSEEEKNVFWQICGPTMKHLKFEEI